MIELRRIDPVSLGIVLGFFGFITGLISGIMIATIPAYIPLMERAGYAAIAEYWSSVVETYGILFTFSAMVITPIALGISWFIAGAISGVLYNLFASRFGGIMIEFKKWTE